jgi:saccharopine dehydrogenase (NAD+, L-lysine-forming)
LGDIQEGRIKVPGFGLKVIVRERQEGNLTQPIWWKDGPGTGLPASIAALMMDAGEVTVKGVVAPEGCIDPAKFLAAFLKRGARIHQTETVSSLVQV